MTALELNQRHNWLRVLPKFKISANDSYDDRCGEVFITKNRMVVVHCCLCDEIYGNFDYYLKHLATHFKEQSRKTSPTKSKETDNTLLVQTIKSEEFWEEGLDTDNMTKYETESDDNVEMDIERTTLDEEQFENEVNNLTDDVNYFNNQSDVVHTMSEDANFDADKLTDDVNNEGNDLSDEAIHMTDDIDLSDNDEEYAKALNIEFDAIEEFEGEVSTDLKLIDATIDAINLSTVHDDNPEDSLDEPANNPLSLADWEIEVPEVFACDKCDKFFDTKPKLDAHTASHTAERKYKCDQCGWAFKNSSSLGAHMQRHTGNKRFPCNMCSKKFFTSTEAKTHMRSHTGETPFICPYCGAGLRTSSALNAHIRKHTNERPYKCNYCEKRFYTREKLNNHTRVHTKERPFKCDICDAAFAQSFTLRVHHKLHTNAKEYACKLCAKSFNQKPVLVAHMKRNHNVLEVESIGIKIKTSD